VRLSPPHSSILTLELKGQNADWEILKVDLQGKLADAEHLNKSLRAELEKVMAESASSNQSLQQQIQEQQLDQQLGQGSHGSGNYQELLRQHETLKQELREQEEVSHFSSSV
jgi:hypothetical protein